MSRDANQTWNSWEWLESLLKVSGVLALFGYISLRAHFNFLGLSAVPALSGQQYLMETYRFGAYIAWVLGPTAAICLIVAWSIPSQVVQRLERFVSSAWVRQSTVPLLTLGLLLFAVRMIQLLSIYGTDVAIGTLRTYEVNRSDGHRFCSISLICIAASWLLLHRLLHVTRHNRRYQSSLKVIAFLLLCSTLQLPILYGYYVHSTEVPRVVLTFGDTKQSEMCGLLLFNTGSDVLLWNSVFDRGQIQQIPIARLQQISYIGQADLLSEMHSSAVHKDRTCAP